MAKRRGNGAYWQVRFAALEEEQYQRSAAYHKDVQSQFRMASKNIQMGIERWYGRLADNNDISYAGAKKLLKKNELEEFQWTVEQYIKAGEENAIDGRWMKELENASARHHISYLTAMRLQVQQHAELLSVQYEGGVADFLNKVYAENFYKSAFEIARGTGVGSNLAALDTRKIDIMIRKPWAQDGANFSDRIWTNKKKLVNNLHTELTQNIIRGASPQKAIDSLAKTMEVSRSQAGTLIMTESAAISAKAQQDCFKELGVEEFEVVETLDGHTCKICQGMDGMHFPMPDYKVGETAPPFHPRCRGCTAPYFADEFTTGEQRAARDEKTGKTYYVPADMKYKEWKEQFVVENGQKDDIIETGAKGALNDKNDPMGLLREKHADTFYRAVRNSDKNSFVERISKNTGITKESISKVYDHVFFNEYELYGGRKRFDPDYDMAESFRRLREGKNIQPHDMILLRHERLEYGLMQKTGRSYEKAHELAESKYNYAQALQGFKKKRGE